MHFAVDRNAKHELEDEYAEEQVFKLPEMLTILEFFGPAVERCIF